MLAGTYVPRSAKSRLPKAISSCYRILLRIILLRRGVGAEIIQLGLPGQYLPHLRYVPFLAMGVTFVDDEPSLF